MFDLIVRGKVDTWGDRLKALQAAIPIVADNVAQYLWADTPDLSDDEPLVGGQLDWNDYPNLRPPFDNYFVEWVSPFEAMQKTAKWHGVHIAAVRNRAIPSGNVLLRCELYFTDSERHNSHVAGPAFSYEVEVAEDGTCVRAEVVGQFLRGGDDENIAAGQRGYMNLMRPAFLATSFMHCRNIAINVVAPPPKLAKAARKRHGVPLVRFRTINIEPMRQVLRTEGRSHETGIKRALHICRGHFRTYSEEKPLFGRVSGTFFIPAHARGSASEGVVVPQYAVDVPDTR